MTLKNHPKRGYPAKDGILKLEGWVQWFLDLGLSLIR
jgi:hypothetical protein